MFVRIYEAGSPEDRAAVCRFRYRVYGDELGKRIPGLDHEQKAYGTEFDEKGHVFVAAAQETGAIVGTLVLYLGSDAPFPATAPAFFALEPMLEALGEQKIAVASAFMVDPAVRGKTVASLLLKELYGFALGRRVDATVCVAELALVQLYQRLGFRTYGAPFRPYEAAGLRVPLVIAVRDAAYLRRVGSPFAEALPANADDSGATAAALRRAYPRFEDAGVSPQSTRALWASLADSHSAPVESGTQGALDDAAIGALLRECPRIAVPRGERVLRGGENERGMGLLLAGRLGVCLDGGADPHIVATIGAGEVFGELAHLLAAARTADVLALEDSEILLLPDTFLEKLTERDAAAAVVVCNGLLRLLGRRLVAMNRQLSAGGSNARERVGVASRASITNSYAITTLTDPSKEMERLEAQARAGRDLECYWLRRLGVCDGMSILDVGSGPGVASQMLAETFPTSRVTGVEPDGMLRAHAEKRVAGVAVGSRCTFVEGTGEQLPLPDRKLDVAYLRFVLQHLPNPVAVLREVRRVLRPGGIVIVLDVDDDGVLVHPEPAGLRDFQRRARAAQTAYGGDRNVGRKLVALLGEAGFTRPRTDVQVVTSQDLAPALLVDLAFSFKTQLLRRAGLLAADDEALVAGTRGAFDAPGAWVAVPVFFGHGAAPT